MIFALAIERPALFVMLTEKDVGDMRVGLTRFVDQRHLKGATFSEIILSLHKNQDEALKIISGANSEYAERRMDPTKPDPGETQCAGCGAMSSWSRLYEDRCIVCWATRAKKAETGNN